MLDESPLDTILDRPDLPVLVEQLNRKLAAESAARDAFRRDLSPSVKAEFILGEVVMHSPAKAKHLRATKRLLGVLDRYVELHKLGEVFSEKALVCLTRNDYEPDIVFYENSKADLFTDDQMKLPAPDFIVEVLSDSTETRDRGLKYNDYQAHGVREYWIVDCDERSVEQYLLASNGKYRLAQKIVQGSIGSKVIVGFEIEVARIFGSGGIEV